MNSAFREKHPWDLSTFSRSVSRGHFDEANVHQCLTFLDMVADLTAGS